MSSLRALPAPAAGPWARWHMILWAALTAAGCGLLFVAWNGASNELLFEDDMVWLQVSVWGVVLALLADTVWFLTGRRSVRKLRVALIQTLRATAPAPAATVVESASMVAAPGMQHFHRSRCQLASHKTVEPASRAEHERAGRVPCGMCRP